MSVITIVAWSITVALRAVLVLFNNHIIGRITVVAVLALAVAITARTLAIRLGNYVLPTRTGITVAVMPFSIAIAARAFFTCLFDDILSKARAT